MKREPYFEAVYRIWGVGPKPEDKLAFWERVNGPTGGTDLSDIPIENQLVMQEMFEYPPHEDEDDEADHYPEEVSIHIWKYCWERGIECTEQALLRYFDFHHSKLLESVPEDPHVRFELFKDILIFSSH